MIALIGLDPDALRRQYPDQAHVLICQGRVGPNWNYGSRAGINTRRFAGYVEAIDIDEIHVPVQFRSSFESLLDAGTASRNDARYDVTLAYGQRWEP